MIGDAGDMQRRLLALLPAGWFGDDAPVLGQLLLGLGNGFSAFWTLLQTVMAQTRILTASGVFLDMIAADFFGSDLVRLPDEPDGAFGERIHEELLRPRGTRAAVALALFELTGRQPAIFEPARTTDTGGYTIGGIGYGAGGGWGSLALPFQFFVTAYRPSGGGIAQLAGYGTGGIPVYGSLSMQAQRVTDSFIQSSIPPLLPVATTAWMNIAN
jgi:hypothetical protein